MAGGKNRSAKCQVPSAKCQVPSAWCLAAVAAGFVTMRVNSPPRRYNGTQSAFADTNGDDTVG